MEPNPILPATERPHPATADLDLAPPGRIAPMLRRAALEIFDGGPEGEPALGAESFARAAQALGRWMAEAWSADPPQTILLSGAGTSGRLAGFLAARFNAALQRAGRPRRFWADIAGGPEAFFRSIEGAEDDAEAGAGRWRAVARKAPVGLTIGITCGLSAPYVAGMARAAVADGGGRAALLGFVPPDQARQGAVFADGRSVRDVVRALEASPRGLVIAPALGPEPLTGSTRMKGGSATIAALSAAFLSGLGQSPVNEALSLMRSAVEATAPIDGPLADLIEFAGRALRAGGRVAYVGRAGAGLLGLIDASECAPTFGDDPETVRGYCLEGAEGGLGELTAPGGLLAERADLIEQASPRALKAAAAEAQGKPFLLVWVGAEEEPAPRPGDLLGSAEAGASVYLLRVPCVDSPDRPVARWAWELAVKTCLNAFSTGAHVRAGKVYGNRMIDLRISNTKLLERAVRIVAELVGAPPEAARRAVATAIHGAAAGLGREEKDDPRRHVAAAAGRSGLVARAILLAAGLSLEETERRMAEEPVVRRVVLALRAEKGGARQAGEGA